LQTLSIQSGQALSPAWRTRAATLLFEHSISGKWLELLKEFVPALARAAVVREPSRNLAAEKVSIAAFTSWLPAGASAS
jgi:hypothetical protein